MKLLVINPGATSTKIAVFEDEQEIFRKSIAHAEAELAQFSHIIDQLDVRMTLVKQVLAESGFAVGDFDAICGRGGLLRHIPSGTYCIDDHVIHDIYNPPYGEHASSLGPVMAKTLADSAGIPSYLVDPVSVDELTDVARISGFAGMERESFFHALNQKATARKAATQLGHAYEEVNLIVVHMGGGVSVAAHQRGRVVDMFNVKDDGSFSIDRGGALPVNAVINLCFSGKTKAEIKRMLGTEAGVFSYLGTRDFREVETRAFSGDTHARLIFDAIAYQHAKDIGAMAAVLHYDIDAIVYTGGIAFSDRLCDAITEYVGQLAPILRLPGEEEMRALADGALRVLRGEPAKDYSQFFPRPTA
ncbi:MAG: butyrate kinase [Clostridia bacterium]